MPSNSAVVTWLVFCTVLLPLPLRAQQAEHDSPYRVAAEIWTELTLLRWGATCEEWERGRFGASCEPFHGGAAATNVEDEWCYRGSAENRRGSVYFYALPLGAPPECRLLRYRARVLEQPYDRAQAIYRLLRDRLSHDFGPPEETDAGDIAEYGSWAWTDIAHWRTGESQILLYMVGTRHADGPGVGLLARGRPLVEAMARDRGTLYWYFALGPMFDIDSLLTAELEPAFPALGVLLGTEESDWAAEEGRAALAAIARLLESARTAPRGRRPMLLLAADRVAEHLSPWLSELHRSDEQRANEVLAELDALGIPFHPNPLGGAWSYDNRLLHRVWELYPETVWGARAFLMLQFRGWDTSNMCAHGTDQFRTVIERGEAFLSARPDSPFGAQIRFTLGLAFETWWSLSRLATPTAYADPADYVEGAQRARTRAISYYRDVLRALPGTELATYARRELPRLKLGVDTSQRWYFCIYD